MMAGVGKWLSPLALLFVVWASTAGAADSGPVYTLEVDGLACPFCAYGIEKQLYALDGVAAIATDVETGTLAVTMDGGAVLDEADATAAVEAAGFTLRRFGIGGAGE